MAICYQVVPKKDLRSPVGPIRMFRPFHRKMKSAKQHLRKLELRGQTENTIVEVPLHRALKMGRVKWDWIIADGYDLRTIAATLRESGDVLDLIPKVQRAMRRRKAALK